MSSDEFRESEGLDQAEGISQEDILSFLRGKDADMENAESPLERLGHTLREQILTDWEQYDLMSEADKERMFTLASEWKGDKLHQLRLLAEDMERASKDVVEAATKFRAMDLDGQQFSTELQSVLQRQKGIHARLESVLGQP